MTTATIPALRIKGLIAGAALGLALAGCGGGDDAREQPTASSTETAATSAVPTAKALAVDKRPKARAQDRHGVTSIAVAPDGSSLGIALADGSVGVLDPRTVKVKKLLKAAGGSATVGLLFSLDSQNLLSAGRDSTVKLWRIGVGDVPLILQGHEGGLRAVAANSGGTLVASAGEETRVMLWDATTGRLVRVLRGATDFVNALSFTPDGRLLAAGGGDARIQVWDTASGQLVRVLLGHADELNALAFSPDGKLLASAGEDGKVIVWDAASGQQVHALTGQQSAIRTLAFSRDGQVLAGGGANGTVSVWDMAQRSLTQEFTAPGTAVNSIAFDVLDPNLLFVGDDQGQVSTKSIKRAKT